MTTSVTHAPGICSRRLNAVLTRTRCLRLRFGVVTPKPRATPRARPSFHSRNADSPLRQQNPPLTSTKAPTKTRGAPREFERTDRTISRAESIGKMQISILLF
jgi:hypothetical protein